MGLLLFGIFTLVWLQSSINLLDNPITLDDVPERIEADRQTDHAVKHGSAPASVHQDVGTQERKRQQPIPDSPLASIAVSDTEEFLDLLLLFGILPLIDWTRDDSLLCFLYTLSFIPLHSKLPGKCCISATTPLLQYSVLHTSQPKPSIFLLAIIYLSEGSIRELSAISSQQSASPLAVGRPVWSTEKLHENAAST
jgi:hypothetical protein